METTENPTTGVKTPQSSYHLTIDEWIGQMKLTFDNAMVPGIYETMQKVGYTEAKINSLKEKLARLENLQQVRTKEYAGQFAESEAFDKMCTENYVLYKTHRDLAKIHFKESTLARASLKLDQPSKRTYSGWYQESTNFYAQLAANPELLAKAQEIGLTAAVVAERKQALLDLQALKESQRRETAEAQAATVARDKAFDELFPLYKDYINYAKVLLANNQALEALGITVKAK